MLLSNRMKDYQAGTLAALKLLGIQVDDPAKELFLKVSPKESNKTSRREQVAELYNVVMFVGDNLRDFSEAEFVAPKVPPDASLEWFNTETKRRQTEADKAIAHWGKDWFILPNPVYGEWDRLIGPDPISQMHPTTMTAEEAKSVNK